MHLRIIPTLLSILFFAQASGNSFDISQLKGLWIEKEYLAILKSSYSPKKSLKDYNGSIPYIEIGNNDIQWLYDYHDGDGYKLENVEYPKPNVITYRSPNGISRFIIDSANNNLLTWENSEIKKQIVLCKVSASNVTNYINSIVISGQYIDNKKCLYSFSDSGSSVWNSKTLNYSLRLDCTDCELDWFTNRSEKDETGSFVVYGFKRTENELKFFKVKSRDGEMLSFSKTPFLVLTKVK